MVAVGSGAHGMARHRIDAERYHQARGVTTKQARLHRGNRGTEDGKREGASSDDRETPRRRPWRSGHRMATGVAPLGKRYRSVVALVVLTITLTSCSTMPRREAGGGFTRNFAWQYAGQTYQVALDPETRTLHCPRRAPRFHHGRRACPPRDARLPVRAHHRRYVQPHRLAR